MDGSELVIFGKMRAQMGKIKDLLDFYVLWKVWPILLLICLLVGLFI